VYQRCQEQDFYRLSITPPAAGAPLLPPGASVAAGGAASGRLARTPV